MRFAPSLPLSLSRIFFALAFVFSGLCGRALIDKLLASRSGSEAVAAWAQLGSLADLVSGASLTGVGIALTAMVAASRGRERLAWLKPALTVCLALSFVLMLLLLPVIYWFGVRIAPGAPLLPMLSLLLGWLAVAPGLLIAWQLGSNHTGRAASLVALQAGLSALALFYSPTASVLQNLLLVQLLFNLLVIVSLVAYLRQQPAITAHAVTSLLRFLPAGLAIGILSPLSSAWARMQIASAASWHVAGQVQAVWRSSEWITAIMAGLLNAYFLPRLSSARDRTTFLAELRHASALLLLPSFLLLMALWLCLPAVMGFLYSPDLVVGRQDALLFLLGDCMRVFSWVTLFGLFALKSAWAISLGELFSLPLFALLLSSSGPLGLQQIGLLWFATYTAYASCNAFMLWKVLRRRFAGPQHYI